MGWGTLRVQAFTLTPNPEPSTLNPKPQLKGSGPEVPRHQPDKTARSLLPFGFTEREMSDTS